MYKIIKDQWRPDLSIVLITYNHKDYIEKCLDSILSQKTEYQYEIIVMDDCSDDGSSEIIARYAEQYKNKVFHFRPDTNLGRGRVAIFKLNPPVRGRYWCHFDGDDYWISDQKIQKQVSFLDENPDFIGCNHNYNILNEKLGTTEKHGAFLSEWTIADMVKGTYPLYSHTSTWVWRNMYYKEGEYNLHLPPKMSKPYTFGDTCLSFFMADHGGKIKKLDDVMTCYRVTGKGAWSQLSKEEQDRRNREIYERLDRMTNHKYSNFFVKKRKKTYLRNFLRYFFSRFPSLKKAVKYLIKTFKK